jgi:16S rRNA (cytosine1402-N4)-methyltransferase
VLHTPVLLEETLALLAPTAGGIYVDGTLGLGGHARAILDRCGPDGRVIGFDRDGDAIARTKCNLASYGKRIHFIRRNFAEIEEGLAEINIAQVDGLLLDLGLSSLQLDASGRGFSFRGNEPLDMRMDDRSPETAADLINQGGADELADIFYYYGEERHARRIAARLVSERQKGRIATTAQLAAIVAEAVPKRFHPKKIHVATKVFQALRIAVNRELENLGRLLDAAGDILKPEGRICVISFHSLEDRLVKWKFREDPLLRVLTKKPVVPDEAEQRRNPRARSAKLRAAVRIHSPRVGGYRS